MTHAYQEIYLSNAQSALGDAFDYAINSCDMKGSDLIKLFLASSVSQRMENGEAKYLAGKSGIDIARDVIRETTGKELTIEPQIAVSKGFTYCWLLLLYIKV